MEDHGVFMERCFELAGEGLGRVSPNPLVGCVIMNEGRIIGEGYHQSFGGPHAEVNALQSVKDRSLLATSTLYVNLEPCSHHGKTPPCCDLIIASGIRNVVIANQDPNPLVNGKGTERLIQSGVNVITGVLEDAANELNKRFFTFYYKMRPYIILKWAQTEDGFIDIDRTDKNALQDNWITGKTLKMLVHKWRSEEDAIMVGTNTALNDNPRLTVREWDGRNPLRIVIDEHLELPSHLHLFDDEVKTIVVTAKEKANTTNIEYITLNFTHDLVDQLMKMLYLKNIQSLIVEGGRELLESFINTGLWDEARVLIGNKNFGNGLKAPVLSSVAKETEHIAGDRLLHYFNP